FLDPGVGHSLLDRDLAQIAAHI
ncbi:MAG: hypothetical protein JWQ87_2424, partial [Candidatus Sulfotelmatobacter sp.]|nr:hypothetical protein [Candidatus Sulfotelmatobacter sp.]